MVPSKFKSNISQRKLLRSIFGIHGVVNINAGLCIDGSIYEEDIELAHGIE